MRVSPESSLLVAPFCWAFAGVTYGSDAMTTWLRVGDPPVATRPRLVIAQTAMRWSPGLADVPDGSICLRKYSACGCPIERAGWGAPETVPPACRLPKRTKCAV